jgi:hypothetical protein
VAAVARIDDEKIVIATMIVAMIIAMIDTIGPGDEMMIDVETARARATGDALEAETCTSRTDATRSTTHTIVDIRANCQLHH